MTPLVCIAGDDLDHPLRFQLGKYKGTCFTRSGPGGYHQNQDAIGVYRGVANTLVMAVADGLGGMPDGAGAARRVIESLEGTAEPSASIVGCIQSANDAMLTDRFPGGCTLIVAECFGGRLVVHHVGDAGGVIVSDAGSIRMQTVAHSPVGQAQAHEGLEEALALAHPQRHVVSNMVGSDDMWVETSDAMELINGDTAIIASDGLWDNFFLHEVVDMIIEEDLMSAASNLIDQATARMIAPNASIPSKEDDLSFILFRHVG
ncbi:MAG: hypothetical protein VYB37_08380 [Pseudomonadota bacterium]|nr:hypothetical protein [Pseudomonadota bacterium]